MNTLKIFCDAPLSPSATRLLLEGVAPHEVLFPQTPAASVLAGSAPDPAFGEADIAFGQPAVAEVERASKLQWMHLSSAGYTRYDTAEFRALASGRGLAVTNSSTVYAVPCAEHAFAMMMAHSRRLPMALESRAASGAAEWTRLRNASVSLRRQCAVILGYGAIASELVNMLAPFGMRIIALRRQKRGDESVEVVTLGELPPALAAAHHVVNLLPENAETIHFMNAQRIAGMKPAAAFYNIGRGTTVDQIALLDALQRGQIEAAWLDVTDPEPLPDDHPLRAMTNCYITPHVAGGHRNEAETLAVHFLGNLERFQKGEPLRDRIL